MKNKTNIFVLLFSIATTSLMAQELLPLSLRQKEELKKQSWVRETPFEPVKVKDMGNRISALAINPTNASHFVVAPHQGGVWLTQNGGETYSELCTTLPSQTITALAMNWQSGTLAVATPYGLFVSTDNGKTVDFKGLAGSKHITAIYLSPSILKR